MMRGAQKLDKKLLSPSPFLSYQDIVSKECQ